LKIENDQGMSSFSWSPWYLLQVPFDHQVNKRHLLVIWFQVEFFECSWSKYKCTKPIRISLSNILRFSIREQTWFEDHILKVKLQTTETSKLDKLKYYFACTLYNWQISNAELTHFRLVEMCNIKYAKFQSIHITSINLFLLCTVSSINCNG
jgi:hypothetical protein